MCICLFYVYYKVWFLSVIFTTRDTQSTTRRTLSTYYGKTICDALQQRREQVAQAYFEIWTIEVSIGVKNNSSVDFEIFVSLHTFICFLSPPCNFWLIFKHFPTKNFAFSAACHIQNYRNRKLLRHISKPKTTLPEKPLTVLYTNAISQKSRSMNLILVSNLNWKCASYNDTKKLILPKMWLVPCFVGVPHIFILIRK